MKIKFYFILFGQILAVLGIFNYKSDSKMFSRLQNLLYAAHNPRSGLGLDSSILIRTQVGRVKATLD